MKTLKDFEPILWCNGEIETELKKEAIKWLDSPKLCFCDAKDFIKHFFNLTKEDIEEYDKANK